MGSEHPPGVPFICLPCELKFMEEICWSCGEPGTSAVDAPDKLKYEFNFQNGFDWRSTEE